jgi:hypothetical protein
MASTDIGNPNASLVGVIVGVGSQVQAQSTGSSAAPSYSFAAYSTAGMYFGTSGPLSGYLVLCSGGDAMGVTAGAAIVNPGNTNGGYFAIGTGSAQYALQYNNTLTVVNELGFCLRNQYEVAKTANYTAVANDAGTRFSNAGASGAITITLPTAVKGKVFSFIVMAAQTLNITAPAGSIFGVGLSGATRTSSTQYSAITLECVDGTNWNVTSLYGTWT